MLVKCEKCHKAYDDARNWTICPHNPLESGPRQADFCRRHDLFGPCPICDPTLTPEQLHPQTAMIIDQGKGE